MLISLLRRLGLGLLLAMIMVPELRAQPVLQFKHLSFNEGLSQNPVFSLCRNKKGFMWIGSREGLTRFDGYTFRLYKADEISSRSVVGYSDVKVLYEDENGILWIGTSSGLHIFDQKTESFRTVIPDQSMFVFEFLRGEHNLLWLATSQGLKCVDIETFKELRPGFSNELLPVLSNEPVFSLRMEQGGIIWAGLNKGLIRFNASSGERIPLPSCLSLDAKLSSARIQVIKEDHAGNVWFGTENSGLFCFDYRLQTCTNYVREEETPGSILSNFIRDILVYDDNTLWIGTRNGLSVLNVAENRFYNYTHNGLDKFSISHNTIWKMMRDDDGNVWIATYAGGINIFNERNQNFFNIGEVMGEKAGLNQLLVNTLLADDTADALWIGTDGGGLNHYDRGSNKFTYHPIIDVKQNKTSNIIKCLAYDRHNNLLVGTLDGLSHFDIQTKRHRFVDFSNNPFKRNTINALAPDTDGGVWIGTENEGLKHLDANLAYDSLSKENNITLSDRHIFSLMRSRDDRLWIGTSNGLNVYHAATGEIRHYNVDPTSERSYKNVIFSLYEDTQDRIWLGTMRGLVYVNPKTNELFPLDDPNLSRQAIQSIVEDNFGNLWVGTYTGIYKIKFDYFRQPFRAADFQIAHYSSVDGLASNQFMLNGVEKNGMGELFWCSVNGVVHFDPQKVVSDHSQPKVMITDLFIHNQRILPQREKSPLAEAIEYTKEIAVSYVQGFNLAIYFSTFDYTRPATKRYAFRMEGLSNNEDWILTEQRMVQYTNLAPGKYRFLVRSINRDGTPSEGITGLDIIVRPPFWRTGVAYALYLAVLASVLFVVIRFFRSKARLKQSLLYKQMEQERQEELYQMKLDFFTNISHEIRTPLTLILAPLEKLEERVQNDETAHTELLYVKDNASKLHKLVTELLDFRKAESGKMHLYVQKDNMVSFVRKIFKMFENLADDKSINYQFCADEEEIEVYFDASKMESVVSNLLSNAFKFTPQNGHIRVAIKKENDEVKIQIADDGKGLSEESQQKLFVNFYQADENSFIGYGSGIGLAYSKSIVELHAGTLSVFSDPLLPTMRTVFTLTLPLGTQHFEERQLIIADPEREENAQEDNHAIFEEPMEDVKLQHAVPKQTILLVEDSTDLRLFLKHFLQTDYRVLEARNGAEGWEQTIEHVPDIIVSDVMMDTMDGLEMCRKIKHDERTNHIPVILLTARTTQDNVVEGLETGADIYLPKPFSTKSLELYIRNLLSTRESARHKFSKWYVSTIEDIQETSPNEKFMMKTLTIIKDNLSNFEFDVSQLASEAAMSVPSLYKKIKALTNMPVNEFIKLNRLQAATLLLKQNQASIADITYMVGFNDRKYFSKEFKKAFGKTPSEYRSSFSDDSQPVHK